MTDDELRRYLGLPDGTDTLVPRIGQEKRAAYERMAEVEMEWNLYIAGLGPAPEGCLLDTTNTVSRRRGWR